MLLEYLKIYYDILTFFFLYKTILLLKTSSYTQRWDHIINQSVLYYINMLNTLYYNDQWLRVIFSSHIPQICVMPHSKKKNRYQQKY